MRTFIKRRFRWGLACATASTALVLAVGGVSFAKKAPALKGHFGCLTRSGIGQATDLFQLVPTNSGGFSSGSLTSSEAEVCTFSLDPAHSSYSINADGTGVMTLAWIDGQEADADEDCTSFTHSYVIVVDSLGAHIELAGGDDEIVTATNTASDPDDTAPASGACTRQ